MFAKNEEAAADWLKETRKGYLRIVVLTLLSRKPHHGYQIMKEIGQRTGGFWKPTPGGIYPILQSLEMAEYIKGEWDAGQKRRRKTYRITEMGRSVLHSALTRQGQIADRMGDLFKEFMKDVLDVKSTARPPILNLFSAFLQEGKEKPEDTVRVLRRKRKRIQDVVANLQKELDTIDKRLAMMKPNKRNS